MKKFIIAAFLFISLNNYSQKIVTTEDDYNYLTIGYPESLSKGLAMKPGYDLVKIHESTFVNCTIELFRFKEIESGYTKAYLIKRINKEKPNKTRFYCLPINNKELFRKYDIQTSNEPIKQEYMIALSKILIESLNENK